METTHQPNEIELVSGGASYNHFVSKVAYVHMTLILEDEGNGWTEEKIIERFKKLGAGAPEAYAAMSYIAELEKSGRVTSRIENVAGNEKDVRRIYRPALLNLFMRFEKPQ